MPRPNVESWRIVGARPETSTASATQSVSSGRTSRPAGSFGRKKVDFGPGAALVGNRHHVADGRRVWQNPGVVTIGFVGFVARIGDEVESGVGALVGDPEQRLEHEVSEHVDIEAVGGIVANQLAGNRERVASTAGASIAASRRPRANAQS